MADEISAYELLSRPTLDITDAEAERIITELRAKRRMYLTSGKVDKPKKEKVASVKLEKDEKARNTALLLASLKLPGQE